MIDTLIIRFKNEISRNQISYFRGAIIAAAGSSSILFHNHIGKRFRYAYPMIQYKIIAKQASIVCFGPGCTVINDLFENSDFLFRIGQNSSQKFEIAELVPLKTQIYITDKVCQYCIKNWLPLSSTNYSLYQQYDNLIDRIRLLEKILVGNILSACKSFDISIEDPIQCNIVQLSTPRTIIHKGVKMLEFDADFTSNIFFPPFLGLGKGVSVGHGTIYTKNNKTL